jgi:hypothetical protein
VVNFDMVRLVALMTRDPKASQHFITHTLGNLVSAPVILRRALLTFLSCGCNATVAAALEALSWTAEQR